VAAISVAGMAVAFPLGAGLALVIGAVLNYVVSPVRNPLLILAGFCWSALPSPPTPWPIVDCRKAPRRARKGLS
jgi:hypothetical protein